MAEQNETKDSKAQGLLAEVADKIKGSGDAVRQRLVDAMVEKELAQRVELLDKAFQKRFELLTGLRKIDRADQETYHADGSVATQSYTKARLDEIKKAKEALEKHENALEKALTSNDFSKLKGG
jgi:N-glycosylase/DNA lyase